MFRRALFRASTVSLASFTPIAMPALSPSMDQGSVTTWLKAKGDKVQSGDVIAKVTTDKATVDFVHQGDDGYLGKVFVQDGAVVQVGAIIAVLVEELSELAEVDQYTPPQVGAAAAAPAATPATPAAPSVPAAAAPAGASKAWPAFASKLFMPSLSPSMNEGTVKQWVKKVGDKITSNDVIAVVTTDKADVDFVHQGDDGYIAKLFVPAQRQATVGAVIAVIVEEESQLAAGAELEIASESVSPAAPSAPVAPAAPIVASASAQLSGDVRALLGRSGPAAIVYGSGLSDEVLRKVVPTGKDGRFTKADLMPFVGTATASPAATAPTAPSASPSAAATAAPVAPKVVPGVVVDFTVSDSRILAKLFGKA